MPWLHRSHKVKTLLVFILLCDVYGPLPLCKVIIEGDKKGSVADVYTALSGSLKASQP